MGNSISRIEKEFIFNLMDEKKISLAIHGDRKEASGIILNIQQNEWIEIYSDEKNLDQFDPEETVRIFFSYYGQVMTFTSRVITAGETLKITFPEGLHKNLQRKYERVPVPVESSLSFTVKETHVEMQFPKTDEFDPVERPEIHGRFDTQDINQLMAAFREEAGNIADFTNISMFRGKKLETLEERIIAQTGKNLYIPRMRYGLPKDSSDDSRLLSESYLFPQGKSSEYLKELSLQELREHFQDQYRQGIESVIYSPILYHQYVVGCIHAKTVRDGKEPLDNDSLEYIFQFAKILAYSLKVNGYFNVSREIMSDYTTGIIDISASGLLFANSSPSLSLALSLYSDLEIKLVLGKRTMHIGTRVMRKYPGKKTTYYGLQFLHIQPEDFRFLFDTVYGKSYDQYDDSRWEGGAEPPTLNFD